MLEDLISRLALHYLNNHFRRIIGNHYSPLDPWGLNYLDNIDFLLQYFCISQAIYSLCAA